MRYIPRDIEEVFEKPPASIMIAPLVGHIRRIIDEELTRTSVKSYYQHLQLIYGLLEKYHPEKKVDYKRKAAKCMDKIIKYSSTSASSEF